MDEGEIVEHYGESRAKRISELHRVNDTPVLGMWEGSFVRWDGSRGTLFGRATAFVPGSNPVDMADGSDFGPELSAIVS